MLSSLLAWGSAHRAVVSSVIVGALVAVPVTIAIAHPGVPVSTADLDPRTVWVTNLSDAMVGRLARPIAELTSAVQMSSSTFEVYQDEDAVLVHDLDGATLSRVDAGFAVLEGTAPVPAGAEIAYRAGIVAMVDPDTGALWIMSAGDPFDGSREPDAVLGPGALAVVTDTGDVVAYSRAQGRTFRYPAGGGAIEERAVEAPEGDLQLTVVGREAVLLGAGTPELVLPSGSRVQLPVDGLQLQQPGPAANSVLVATATSLLEVPLGGGAPVAIEPGLSAPATSSQLVAAPVRHEDCVYGAWSSDPVEVHRCSGGDTVTNPIARVAPGDTLVFRTNRSVIVLNNIVTGDTWALTDSAPLLIDNWADVRAVEPDTAEGGDEEGDDEIVEDTEPDRSGENRDPIAKDDALGARPGVPTLIPVLENDTDPDGDLLTIRSAEIVGGSGVLELVEAGRALQLTPDDIVSGTMSIRYTADDGRGGAATALANVAVSADAESAPQQQRVAAVTVEQGATIAYQALGDWIDPDGDETFVAGATAAGGDIVRFTPAGLVTFSHVTTELGRKEVSIVVSDGAARTDGTLLFTVVPRGTLDPVALADHATGFVGDRITISPLVNDRSPSGEPLQVLAVAGSDPDAPQPTVDANGLVTVTTARAGTFYLTYVAGAGSRSSEGLIRLDVLEDPDEPLPPVAVRDVAYLRPGQTVELPVLANDVSPSGRLLGVTSVEDSARSQTVTVEVLKNTLVRVSASEALASSEPITLTYTVSDGSTEATAAIVVVPVPPLVNHQTPAARDDSATVRVGDAVTIPVLDNDTHPDEARIEVLPDLVTEPSADEGFAFVSGDDVRFQAGDEPGVVSLSYAVLDEFGQRASATVTITVTPRDDDANTAPVAPDLEARLFAGTSLRIDIPTSGVDPDGDSVTLVGTAQAPHLGTITQFGDDWLRYEAAAASGGTDEFTYVVEDETGAVGQGTIRIAVLPVPTVALPPRAVNDTISIQPDRTATVAVLDNDSDPSGRPVSLAAELDVPPGIEARAVEGQVVVESSEEGYFTIGYTISNGNGGTGSGFLQVSVDDDAPLRPPVAVDHRVGYRDTVGLDAVEFDVLVGAQNPGGLVADLEVGLVGPGASFADVLDGGRVRVELGDERRVIAYTLTTEDGLTATAFLMVPRRVGPDWAPPPFLRLDLPPQTVESGVQRTWSLTELLVVPSGRSATIVGPETVTANQSDGSSAWVDETTISFRSVEGYVGPASVTFQVTDGSSEAFITLPIEVTGSSAARVPPTFTSATLDVLVAESATLDLRAATSHPDPAVVSGLSYGALTGQSTEITGSISGSTLTVAAAAGSTGRTQQLTFEITGGPTGTVTASVIVRVVPSTRPLPQLRDDQVLTGRGVTETIAPLANDGNPFPDVPLRIVDAVIENNGAPGATVSHTSSSVRLVPAPGFVGTFSVLYSVMDATGDASRVVSARIEFVYRDVPGTPASVTPPSWGDRSLTVVVPSEPPNNNADIDRLEVAMSPGGVVQQCAFTAPCVFPSTNGVQYCFTARAHNVMGWGPTWNIGCESSASTPVAPSVQFTPSYTGITLNWVLPQDTSGGVSYVEYAVDGGSPSRIATSTNGSVFIAGAENQCYTISARSGNKAGASGWTSGQACVPPRPSYAITGIYRTGNATIMNPGDAAYVGISFRSDTPPGSYPICATSGGTGRTHWWWAYQGGSPTGDYLDGIEQCGTITINSSLSNQPFGWVVPDAAPPQTMHIVIPDLGIDFFGSF